MHPSLRVIGVLSDPMVSVVLGFGFCWWASVEAVHEPAGVVPVHSRGGDLLQVGQRAQWPVAERGPVTDAFGLVQPDGGRGQGVVEGIADGADRGAPRCASLCRTANREVATSGRRRAPADNFIAWNAW
jgi:hypothetical protein